MRRVIAHRLKWDDEGVASTVGTIMALLVFLTFLSMIVNSYVPVWMKDSESSHVNVALGQFGGLKSGIDMQILAGHMSELAGEHFTPVTTFSPVTLGVDGVPIFSAPTLGELVAVGGDGSAPWNVSFKYYPNKVVNTSASVNELAYGSVTLNVANRYFVPQTIAYENGGIVKFQSDGQVLRVEPSFELTNASNSETVSLVMIVMLGNGTMQGTTTEGVLTKVVSVDTEVYSRVYTDVFVHHRSLYGLAWYDYFTTYLNKALNVSSDAYKPCPSTFCFKPTQTGGPYGIKFKQIQTPFFMVNVTWNSAAFTFDVWIQLKNDSNPSTMTMPIKSFRIQKALVNMAVGGLGSQVNI